MNRLLRDIVSCRWRRFRVRVCVLLVIAPLCFLLILSLRNRTNGETEEIRSTDSKSPLVGAAVADSKSPVRARPSAAMDAGYAELKRLLDERCNSPSFLEKQLVSSEEGRLPGIEHYELALVQVVTRHGDRSPIYDVPLGNPSAFRCPEEKEYFSVSESEVTGSCGRAMLTLAGCRQHQVIGRHLQKAYGFVREDIESKILVLSTGSQRTVRSALCLVSGLLGHTGYNQVMKTTSAMFRDSAIRYSKYAKNCQSRDKLWDLIHNQMTFQRTKVKWERVKSKVNRFVAGLGASPVQDVMHLFDTVVCHYCHLYSRGVHASITPCIGEHCIPASSALEVIHAADLATKHNYDPKISVVLIQPLLGLILSKMEDWISGSMKKHFILYSGHDTTMTALLSALEAFDGHRPSYAARVVFELWKAKTETNGYLVRILYNGRVMQSNLINRTMSFALFKERIVSGYLRDPVSYESVCLKGSW